MATKVLPEARDTDSRSESQARERTVRELGDPYALLRMVFHEA